MMAATTELPASVQEIADVIGRDDALRLVWRLPRCQVEDKRKPGATQERVMLYVPKKMKPAHPLVRILGAEQAQKMVATFGGEILHPANCRGLHRAFRDREVRRQRAEGLSIKILAISFDLSERQIRNLVRAPANDNAAESGGA